MWICFTGMSRLGIYGKMAKAWSWWIQQWPLQVRWVNSHYVFRWVSYASKKVQRNGWPCQMLFQFLAMKEHNFTYSKAAKLSYSNNGTAKTLLESCNTLSGRSSVTTTNTIVCKLVYGLNASCQNNSLYLLVPLFDLATALANIICYTLFHSRSLIAHFKICNHLLTSTSLCQWCRSMFVHFIIIVFK